MRGESTTYDRYSGFDALGQPSTLTLSNGTTTRYTYDSRIYRLKTLHTVKGSTVRQAASQAAEPEKPTPCHSANTPSF